MRQKAMITFFMIIDSAYLQSFYYRLAAEQRAEFDSGRPE
jgi:hypothetical protein